MAEQKTKPTLQPVDEFLNTIEPDSVRNDCHTLIALMKKITKEEPKMWGNIVGFGEYHYRYESGHEGYSCLTGFSPRKQNLSLYVLLNSERQEQLLKKLGEHKAGKGCLYIKQLKNIDVKILEELIKDSTSILIKKYGTGKSN